jgi:hypothetical protein
MRIVIEEVSDKKIVLQMKRWCRHFSDVGIKGMIIFALNRTICETNTRLKGYFISDSHIYLVLNVSNKQEKRFVDTFLFELHQVLIKHAKDNFELEIYLEENGSYNNLRDLFRFCDFFDPRLYHLLIGRNCEPPYRDEALEEMKAYLMHNKYASYRNYRGEKGPVIFPISRHQYKR